MELERMHQTERRRKSPTPAEVASPTGSIDANANDAKQEEDIDHVSTSSRSRFRDRMAPPPMLTSHLNLSIPLHVQVPPLPSPNTTAAATALFRVNQLPSSSVSLASPTVVDGLNFRKPTTPLASPTLQHHHQMKKPTKRQRIDTNAIMAMYPTGAPTPTTAAAAAAAMMLSNASPASHPFDLLGSNPYDADTTNDHQYSHRSIAMNTTNGTNSSTPTTSTANPTTNAMLQANGSHNGAVAGNPNASNANVGDNSTPSNADLRRRKVGIPKFLRYLFQMLEYEENAIIAWSHDGTAFQIRDPDELAEKVLPKYFKHNKVSSFQRQLNYFGFKKWTKTQTNICTFSHPCFVRDQQDKMRLIKRKERSTRGNGSKDQLSGLDLNDDDANTTGLTNNPDAGHDDEALSDDFQVAKLPPAKRAKVHVHQHPTIKTPATTTAAPSKPRGRPPVKKEPKAPKEPKPSKKKTNQSPSLPHLDASIVSSEPPASSRGRKTPQQLPTISPASSTSSSGISTTTLNRLVANTSPSSTGGYDGRSPPADAAPVMAVHSEMLLQHHQHHHHQQQLNTSSYMRRLRNVYDEVDDDDDGGGGSMTAMLQGSGSGGYDTSGNSGWPSHHQHHQHHHSSQVDTSSYALAGFKFPDPTASGFDLDPATHTSSSSNSGGTTGGSAPMPTAKDYLDVLLEGATMDEQIATQTGDLGAVWDSTYQTQQTYNTGRDPTPQDTRRIHSDAAIATYHMLTPPTSSSSNASGSVAQVLPSIEDMQGARF